MGKLIYSLLLVLLIAVSSSTALAENPELGKCTCDTQPENEPNNGAWVKNASACWSTEVADRQWCDITVESLVGSPAHSAMTTQLLDRKNDSAALYSTIQVRFQEFIVTAADAQLPLNVNQAREGVSRLLKANLELISRCVSVLQDHMYGKGGVLLEGKGGFRCRVGETSGWLRLEFEVGEVWLAYMIAPPPS